MTRQVAQNIPYSVNLSALNQTVSIPNIAALRPGTGSFAVSFWYRPDTLWTVTHIIAQYNNGGYANGWLLNNINGGISVYANAGGPQLSNTDFFNLGIDKWYHVTMTANSVDGKLRLYRNGVLIQTSTATSWNITATGGIVLGAGDFGAATGKFADAIYWIGTIPTDAQVADLYYKNQIAASPVARYLLNEGNGTTVSDSIGTNHASLTNSPAWSTDTPRHQTQNALQYSESFTASIWSKINVTPTTTAAVQDPLGGYNASIMTEFLDASPLTHVFRQVTSPTIGKVVTFSVFLKKKDRTHGAVYSRGGGVGTYVDLTTGVLGTKGGTTYLGAQCESYPNGWWRVGVSFVDDGGGHSIYMANADGGATYQGDGTSGTYVFGAQVDLGTQMTPYRRVDQVPYEKSARNFVAQRQNLYPWADDMSHTYAYGNVTLVNNNGLDIYGNLKAMRITDNSTSGTHYMKYVLNSFGTGIYTISTYVRPINSCSFTIAVDDNVSGKAITVDGSTMQVSFTNTVGSNTDLISYDVKASVNGLYRVSITINFKAASPLFISIALNKNKANSWGWVYSGSGDSMEYWGLQVVKANWAGALTLTTGTEINEGNIRNIIPQSQNLFTNSQAIESWVQSQVSTPTTNILAPDGTLTARRVTENSAAGVQHCAILTVPTAPTIGKIYTLSVEAKSSSRWLMLTFDISGVNGMAYFDLTTGVKGTLGTLGLYHEMVPTQNGYYRCSVTYVATSNATSQRLGLANGAGGYSYNGDGVSYIDMWEARLVQANWAGPRQTTTSAVYNNGNIRNVVPQLQNLTPYSNTFSNAAWTKATGVAASDNTTDVTDPFGGNAASKITYDGSGSVDVMRLNAQSLTRRTLPFTYSIWLRTASAPLTLRFADSGSGTGLQTITVTSTWQQFTLTTVIPPTTLSYAYMSFFSAAGNNAAFTVYAYNGQTVCANWAGARCITTTAIDTGNIRNTA